MTRQMKLGLSMVQNGTHLAAWRHPASPLGGALDFKLWKGMAQAAEAAKIHFMFWADGAAVRINAGSDEDLSYNGRIEMFEPTSLMAALSAVTEHIGLIATASTTYNEPYSVARKFASLDYLSGGRVGWNVVTSWSEQEAQNFNRDKHLDHSIRYQRAEEFFNVVIGLWDSWEDDAFIRDREGGQYFDPAKMHVLQHRGASFSVRGPLNIARPVQGYPVIAQAGSSEPGQELAARTADLVYTAQQTLAEAQAFYASVKGRLAKYGRGPSDLLVMPGAMIVVGETDAAAQAELAELEALIHPRIGMGILERTVGDMSGHDIDGPVPEMPGQGPLKSIRERALRLAREQKLTIRQLYTRLSGGSGHHQIVGSAQTVADEMEAWFTRGGCDGFNLMLPYYPGGLDKVLGLLVPELRRRGLFRTEYEGPTLRENLGFKRPPHGAGVPAAIHV